MSEQLRQVLSRWEINPPAICAEEAYGKLRDVFDILCDQSVLHQTTIAGTANCTECGERYRVTHIADKNGKKHSYIHCRDCGVIRVPASSLERWEIDTRGFLATAFRGVSLALQERVAGYLWQVGKANWAGRTREVWFARACRRNSVSAAVELLGSRPKAIVFAPTEAGAARWHEATENLVIALESTLSFRADEIQFDAKYVESRIIDAGMGAGAAKARRTKKRGDRAAKIELLKKELIVHLREAHDHAFATEDDAGGPQLLPRPTQKALGERVGLSEWDVSRCLRDRKAKELNLYWKAAIDLGQIMNWKGPISTGPSD